jgi:DNA-binding transcriptional ArsR family regulator
MLSELETLFSSAARVQVLRLFLLHPEDEFYQREIEREIGQPIRAVQREVGRLSEIGLLSSRTEGNRVFYRLNPDFPLLAEMKVLFQKAVGGEMAEAVPESDRALPPEPASIVQPFEWMETTPVLPLPPKLHDLQVEGEWDRSY